MIVQQRINTNSAFVEEKECQQTVLKRNSDRKIELASHFNPSFLSTLPIAEGKKKILLLKYKFFENATLPKDTTNQIQKVLPELLVRLQGYFEKSLEGSYSHSQNKPLIDRSIYELFQLCAGLGIQRNQELKTKQLSLLYFLLYYFPIRLQNISSTQFSKERFFKYIDENKNSLSPSAWNDFEGDFDMIKDIAEYFYSRALYLDSSKGEQIYSYLNFKRFINEDMAQTCRLLELQNIYTVSSFANDTFHAK